MAYLNNQFCWHGVISTDTEAAASFYTKVLGWEVQTAPMGDGEATMFAAAGVPRAHLGTPQAEGVPSHWDNYLRVDDVDARTAAALTHGGTLLVPPTDIPPGRFSVVASPSGAAISLFHEADEGTAANAPDGQGAIHWVELHSHDLTADIAWLEATLGFTTETMQMPDGPYLILKDGADMVGGAMPAANPQAPSMWLTWVHVADVDAAVERVGDHGGAVHSELIDVPGVGRMAVVGDSTGGVFGIITPS